MQAVVIPEFGISKLKIISQPEPEPGPDEVLVKIRAVSLNYRDYLTVDGLYNPRYKLPLVPCSDGAGEVIACGADIKDFQTGDRVLNLFAPDWLSGIPEVAVLRRSMGGPLQGTLSELRVFPERALIKIPEPLTYHEAATLPCAGLTAWSALTAFDPILADQTVVCLGTGGVSIFALQFATAMGARVIITSSSDTKLEKAHTLGAKHTINYITKTEWGRAVLKLTNLRGADHIIEVGGAGTLSRSLQAVKIFGQILMIGILAGRESNIDMVPVLMKNIRLQGVVVGSREQATEMLKFIQHKSIKPQIDRVFKFNEFKEAFNYLVNGKHFGKIIIEL